MSDRNGGKPRLRGGPGAGSGPWPIGQIPSKVIRAIGKRIVLGMAVGRKDITGDEFGDIFANAVDGMHYSSPQGLADVAFNGTG